MTRATAALAAVALLLLGPGCSRDKVEVGHARLTFDGRVLVAEGAAAYDAATDGVTLSQGDKVKVLDGTATLELATGTIELRRGSEIQVGKVPTLLAGEGLVVSGAKPLDVRTSDAAARVTGAARFERGLVVTLASYTGSARLSTSGRRLTVPALRQATAPGAGVLPSRPSPVVVDESDAWDRRFLGLAIELDRQLEARSSGFTAQLDPDEGRTVGFFKQVLPALGREPAFSSQLLEEARAPGETLVGASIALAGKRASFLERWAGTFSFRSDGAAWGIVALDQLVKDVPGLTGAIDAAIGLAPLRFAALARNGASPSAGDDGGSGAPPTAPRTPTTPTDPGGGGGGGGGDDPEDPPPILEPPDTGTPVDPAVDPLAELVDNLSNDLEPPALP